MAQRPVCGDVIILQVGVNKEADLQIFHTRIIANYRLIQETSTLAPLWPSPHRQHTNDKEEGDPGERPGLRVMRTGNLERKDPSTPSAQLPCPSSDSALSSFGRVCSPWLAPLTTDLICYSHPPMPAQLFLLRMSLAQPHSQKTHSLYQLGMNITFHKGKRMENYETPPPEFLDLCKVNIFC